MSSLNRLIPILTIFNYWFSCLYTVLYPTLSWKTGFLRLIINCQTDWICNGCCICRQKVRRKVVAGCSRNRKAGFLHGTATSGCRRAPSSTATIPVSYLQIHFTIWDKYSLKIETNTLSNLRQILWFPASSELNCCYHSCFIFTNTFYNMRQIHFTIWDKYSGCQRAPSRTATIPVSYLLPNAHCYCCCDKQQTTPILVFSPLLLFLQF